MNPAPHWSWSCSQTPGMCRRHLPPLTCLSGQWSAPSRTGEVYGCRGEPEDFACRRQERAVTFLKSHYRKWHKRNEERFNMKRSGKLSAGDCTSWGCSGAIWRADSWSPGAPMTATSSGLGSTPSPQPLAGRLAHCSRRQKRQINLKFLCLPVNKYCMDVQGLTFQVYCCPGLGAV